MAYRRRRTYRKKRTYRRKPNYKRKYKSTNKGKMPTYLFKRNVELLNVASDATDTFGVYNFSLVDLPDYAEFQALFEFYRINMVKVSFIPVSNVTLRTDTGISPQTIYSNRLFTTLAKSSQVAPTTMDEMRQDSTLKWTPNNRIHKRIIYPRLVNSDAAGSSTGQYQIAGKPWLETTSANADFWGLKWGLEGSLVGTQAYRVEATYYLQFKQTK